MTGNTLNIVPTAAEPNVISVSSDGTTIRVEDTATPLQTDGTCTLDEAAVASCSAAGVVRIVANLGSGDDELTVTAPLRTQVSGRQGADLIRVRNGVTDPLIDCGEDTDPPTVIEAADTPFLRNCEDFDDGSVPETAIVSGPPPVLNPAGAGVSFEFSASEPGVTFNCRLDAEIFGNCSSPFTTALLTEGEHTFAVAATDPYGNTDPTEATSTFIVDQTPPNTSITSGPADITDTRTPTFGLGASEPGVSFICQIDDSPIIACSSPFTTPELTNDEHIFRVWAQDAAGNLDQTGASRRFIVAASSPVPPKITEQPVVIVLGSIVLISGRTVKMSKSGTVPVSLNCAGSRVCAGTVTLTTAAPVRITARKIARLGKAKFNIKPQKKKLVRVRLTKTARKLVKRLRRVRSRATIREIDLRGNPRISSRLFTLRSK